MDESDGLENRCTSHFCHQRLGLMKEAPSNEGDSLVSAAPPIGKAQGWVLVTVGGVLTGPDGSPNLGPSVLLRQHLIQLGTLDGCIGNI